MGAQSRMSVCRGVREAWLGAQIRMSARRGGDRVCEAAALLASEPSWTPALQSAAIGRGDHVHAVAAISSRAHPLSAFRGPPLSGTPLSRHPFSFRFLSSSHDPLAASITGHGESRLNTETCSTIEAALDLLQSMTSMGCQPNTVTYTALQDGLLKKNKGELALPLLTEMAKQGCSPNTKTHTAVINWFVKEGKVEAAMELLKKMPAKNDQPDIITCREIKGHMEAALESVKEGKVEAAMQFLKKMPGMECQPDTTTYISLLAGLLKEEEVDLAVSMGSQMAKNGCSLDTVTEGHMEAAKEGLEGHGGTHFKADKCTEGA